MRIGDLKAAVPSDAALHTVAAGDGYKGELATAPETGFSAELRGGVRKPYSSQFQIDGKSTAVNWNLDIERSPSGDVLRIVAATGQGAEAKSFSADFDLKSRQQKAAVQVQVGDANGAVSRRHFLQGSEVVAAPGTGVAFTTKIPSAGDFTEGAQLLKTIVSTHPLFTGKGDPKTLYGKGGLPSGYYKDHRGVDLVANAADVPAAGAAPKNAGPKPH